MENQDKIATIKALLTPNPDFDKILDTLEGINIRVPTIYIPAGNLISRARCELAPFKPKHKSEIYFITDPSKVGLGRANLPGEPVFYGSLLTENHDKKYFYGLSILEATKLVNNSDTSITCEYPVVGYWKTNEEIKTAVIIGDNDMKLLNEQLKKMFNYISTQYDAADIAYQSLDYFSHEFGKEVKRGEEYLYAHTASLTYLLLLHNDYDAVIYPSTKSEGDGVNIAIKRVAAEKLDLLYAQSYINQREGKGFRMLVENTAKTDKIGNLNWME